MKPSMHLHAANDNKPRRLASHPSSGSSRKASRINSHLARFRLGSELDHLLLRGMLVQSVLIAALVGLIYSFR